MPASLSLSNQSFMEHQLQWIMEKMETILSLILLDLIFGFGLDNAESSSSKLALASDDNE
jgi:hypothetical protein